MISVFGVSSATIAPLCVGDGVSDGVGDGVGDGVSVDVGVDVGCTESVGSGVLSANAGTAIGKRMSINANDAINFLISPFT